MQRKFRPPTPPPEEDEEKYEEADEEDDADSFKGPRTPEESGTMHFSLALSFCDTEILAVSNLCLDKAEQRLQQEFNFQVLKKRKRWIPSPCEREKLSTVMHQTPSPKNLKVLCPPCSYVVICVINLVELQSALHWLFFLAEESDEEASSASESEASESEAESAEESSEEEESQEEEEEEAEELAVMTEKYVALWEDAEMNWMTSMIMVAIRECAFRGRGAQGPFLALPKALWLCDQTERTAQWKPVMWKQKKQKERGKHWKMEPRKKKSELRTLCCKDSDHGCGGVTT